MNDRLYRSRDERVLAGVAGGLGDYFGMDPTIVRVIWVLLVVLSGGGFIVIYIVMAFVVPEEPLGVTGPLAAPGTETACATAVPGASGDWRVLRAQERARRREARALARAEGGSVRTDRGPIVFGLILIVLGGWFLLEEYFPALDFDKLWPLLLIGIGVVILAGAIRRGSGGGAGTTGPTDTGTPA